MNFFNLTKRSVSQQLDYQPGIHHIFEANLIKEYTKNKKVLDIGCWTGQFLSLIEDQAVTVGLELDQEAVRYANKYHKGKYIVGSALQIPFKDNSFDVVTMWDVIEHLPVNSEISALKEASRVLKSNGFFALSTMTTHPFSILFDPAFFLLHHRHYSKRKLHKLLNPYFKIIKIIYGGGIWTLITDNLNLLQKHILRNIITKKFLSPLVKQEFQGKGFVEIHLICQKI